MNKINTKFFNEEEKQQYNALMDQRERTQTAFNEHIAKNKNDLSEEKDLIDDLNKLDTEIYKYFELSLHRYIKYCKDQAEAQGCMFTDIIIDDVTEMVRAISKDTYEDQIKTNEGQLHYLLYTKYYNIQDETDKEEQAKCVSKIEEIMQTMKAGGIDGFVEYINLTVNWNYQGLALVWENAYTDEISEAIDNAVTTWARENYTQDGEQLKLTLDPVNKTPHIPKMPTAILPSLFTRPTSLLANSIIALKDREPTGLYAIKNVPTIICLDYSHLEERGVKGIENLTKEDKKILNAIISIIKANPGKPFTAGTVYRVLTGNFNANIKPDQAKDIETHIDTMRYIDISIDGTQEAKARGFDDITSLTYSGTFLELRKVVVKQNRQGKIIEYTQYIPIAMPIIMQYSEAINQICTVPISVLNAPVDNRKRTEDLKFYLMEQIDAMHKKSNRSNSILFETLYKELEATDPKQKDSIRKNTIKLLDYWKGGKDTDGKKLATKYIKDYECIKRGNSYYSIKIYKG